MIQPTQNFIQKESPKKKIQKPVKKIGWGIFFIAKLIPSILFILIILTIIIGAILSLTFLPHYKSIKASYALTISAKENLTLSEQYLRDRKFNDAYESLEQARENFSDTQEIFEILKEKKLFQIKYFKNQLQVADDLIEIGETMSSVMANASLIGSQIEDILGSEKLTFKDLTIEKKRQILEVLYSSTTKIEKLHSDFNTINQKLLEVNRNNPTFLYNSVIEPLNQKIPKLKSIFDDVMIASRLFPALTGYPEEKKYLLLLLNNREMRPGGGFIGTYGVLRVKDAEIIEMDIDNSYNLDVKVKETQKIEPPEPIEKYMNQDNWFFRDSNWWPDFTASSEKSLWFYDLETDKQNNFDGVIAFTPNLIENLLGITGDFSISDLVFSSENFWELLEFQVEYNYYKQGIPVEERKDIIGDLAKGIIERMYTLPMNSWPEVLEMVDDQLKQKQLVFYFDNPVYQNMSRENSWSGEVTRTDSDYLMLVDSNLAALKTDSVMDRTISYNLSQEEDDIVVEARVHYQNLGDFTWSTTRYRTYTRLYTPKGSQLISLKAGDNELAKDEIDYYNEFDKTAFGLFFEVEPKQSKTIVWRYTLPSRIKDQIEAGKYTLLLQKQIGLPKLNVQLNLTFDSKIKGLSNNTVNYTEQINKDEIYNIYLDNNND
jgi:hypothetical protein